jgi:omega-amidase
MSHLHALQLNSLWEQKEANFQRVQQLLSGVKYEAGDLIVLPEMFGTGFSMNLVQTAELEQGPTEQFLTALAAETACTVIGGVVTTSPKGAARNQALVLEPEGQLLARYSKQRLFSPAAEATVYTAGTAMPIFQWAGLRCAVLICYDLRFPELARQAVLAGAAEMLIYIAAWPAQRAQHWTALLKARAIENQAYVLGVNRCGREPQNLYAGGTLLVSPQGQILAELGDQESVLTHDIQPARVHDWRAQFPALRDAGFS